jgi:hypothetical protein
MNLQRAVIVRNVLGLSQKAAVVPKRLRVQVGRNGWLGSSVRARVGLADAEKHSVLALLAQRHSISWRLSWSVSPRKDSRQRSTVKTSTKDFSRDMDVWTGNRDDDTRRTKTRSVFHRTIVNSSQ